MQENLVVYKTHPKWRKHEIPQGFKKPHNTREGTWAKLKIIQGEIDFDLLDDSYNVIKSFHFDEENQPPMIEPQVWHQIKDCSDDTICELSFYCDKADFAKNKYNISSRTHSEVVEASKIVPKGKALDLGCGQGRNSIYLNLLGFDVTAVDISSPNIEYLKDIINDNELTGLNAYLYDINSANIKEYYDFILSTVVFMFIHPDYTSKIINNMQEYTNKNGYNLIVSVVNSDDYPANVPFFNFTFSPNELKNYYKTWKIIKYNENVGSLHKKDENGNPYMFRFATLLAKKI